MASPSSGRARERVKLLAGNGRHDQGVIADVVATEMSSLRSYLERRGDVPDQLLLLDGITTPANVGMILRSATAAGIDGVVVPHRGVASLDPLVVKASAGTAFRAPVLRARTAGEAAADLVEAGRTLIGLSAGSSSILFESELPRRAATCSGASRAG